MLHGNLSQYGDSENSVVFVSDSITYGIRIQMRALGPYWELSVQIFLNVNPKE